MGSGHDRLSVDKFVIGSLFGGFLAFNMIWRSDKIPKFTIWFVAALLLWLVIHEFRTGPRMEAIVTAVMSIVFLGVQVAFSALFVEAAATSPAGTDAAAPAVKE